MSERDSDRSAADFLRGLDFAAMAREKDLRHRQERDELIAGLIELADTIQDLAAHCRSLGEGAPPLCRTLQIVERQAIALLQHQEVRPMAAIGSRLDLTRHEVVKVEANPGVQPDTVLAELRRGYLRGESVLRRAKVVISSGDHSPTPSHEEDKHT